MKYRNHRQQGTGAWVLEGRYDAFFDIKLSFQNNVLKDGAPYAKYKDKLSYVPYKGIPTCYILIFLTSLQSGS